MLNSPNNHYNITGQNLSKLVTFHTLHLSKPNKHSRKGKQKMGSYMGLKLACLVVVAHMLIGGSPTVKAGDCGEYPTIFAPCMDFLKSVKTPSTRMKPPPFPCCLSISTMAMLDEQLGSQKESCNCVKQFLGNAKDIQAYNAKVIPFLCAVTNVPYEFSASADCTK